MPKWMHDRADHIQAKNPDMPKSEAFAIATQQMHALGKSPKGYGTAEGRATAKKKFDTPKDDVKSANPGGLQPKTAMLDAFVDELAQIKQADEVQDSSFSERNPNMTNYLKATGAGTAAIGGMFGAGKLTEMQATSAHPENAGLMEHLQRTARVPVERPSGPVVGGAHFSPGTGIYRSLGGPEQPHVKVPKDWTNPAFLAHELGHADIHASRVGRAVQNSVTHDAASKAAPMVGAFGGLASGLSDDPTTRRAAILAPLALHAPTLAYEAGASIQGLRKLRQGGAGMGAMLRAGGALLPAYGTYALRAGKDVAGAAAGQAMGTAVRDHGRRFEKEKDAGVLGELAGKAKKVLTTHIPGTPEIMPNFAHAAEKLKGLGGGGGSKGFQNFQAARAAAGH